MKRLFSFLFTLFYFFIVAFRRGLIASGLTGGSLIAEVLLLNANVLGVAASPLMDFEDIPL